MSGPDVPEQHMPIITRPRDTIFRLDFRHVDMLRTEALMAAREFIDAEVAPGTQIGTLLDVRGMNQYSFSTSKLLARPWNHKVTQSAWLLDPADSYSSQRARDALQLPYPVGLFFDQDDALQWLESPPDTPPRF